MTEAKEPRQIPISDDLQVLLEQIRREQQLTSEYIFTYKGNRVEDVKTAFNAATKRAGIMDFNSHDLRHTCASHMAMKGAGMKEIQEIFRTQDHDHDVAVRSFVTGPQKESGQPPKRTDRISHMSQNCHNPSTSLCVNL